MSIQALDASWPSDYEAQAKRKLQEDRMAADRLKIGEHGRVHPRCGFPTDQASELVCLYTRGIAFFAVWSSIFVYIDISRQAFWGSGTSGSSSQGDSSSRDTRRAASHGTVAPHSRPQP